MGLDVSDTAKGAIVRELVSEASAEFEAQAAAAKGAQLAMFSVPLRSRGGAEKAAAMQREIERRQGPGRPPGAQNLTTREFRNWLLGKGISPLASLMRYAIVPPDMLAAELGCTKIEAFREWRILQSELAPYLHAKLAFVDDQGQAVPFMQFVVAGQAITVNSGETPWDARERIAREMQQNQGLSALAPPQSHDDQSHGSAK